MKASKNRMEQRRKNDAEYVAMVKAYYAQKEVQYGNHTQGPKENSRQGQA